VEYAFCPLTHYTGFESQAFPSAGEMMDVCFESRDRDSRLRQRAADILRLLTQADNRLRKKLEAQRAELKDCERAGIYKKYGDLITANLYALERGMSEAELVDYEEWNEETESYGTCLIALDERMTPSGNAQAYYKKYAKARNAKVELAKQIELGEAELAYIYTVFDALTRAETANDLAEIRDELYRSGYASRMKGYAAPKKQPAPTVAKFKTTGGYLVYCGKNNLQNEHITHKLADRNDYWFHAKGVPGSHVVMVTNGEEPDAQDFTDAASIAAHYSKAAGGAQIPVDYLLVRHVRKVPGAKPGFVTYHTNWTAYVTPDAERIAAMRIK
jgi:predicted ribosome quality control (RQC) complex YloA/Tae2 family protein